MPTTNYRDLVTVVKSTFGIRLTLKTYVEITEPEHIILYDYYQSLMKVKSTMDTFRKVSLHPPRKQIYITKTSMDLNHTQTMLF